MPPICITVGDPAGIGPEVTFKALKKIQSHPGILLFMHESMINHPNNELQLSTFDGQLSPGEIKMVPVANDHTPNQNPNDPANATIAYDA